MRFKCILSFILISFFVSCKSTSQEVISSKEESTVDSKFAINISKDEARRLIAKGDIVLVDVRTPEEIAEGKIEGALEIDFRNSNFLDEFKKLETDKTYLLYCRSGNRSGQAMDNLGKNGFQKLYNLNGGYAEWSAQ